MKWARTLRIDTLANDAVRERISAALLTEGVRVRFGAQSRLPRTYALVEGTASIDPAELDAKVSDGRWYDEAIIVLAIEPAPKDALPVLQEALGGEGRPDGVLAADVVQSELIVEFRPSRTRPGMILQLIDTELARYHGYRRTHLLAPVPEDVLTAVAAQGLGAPEIAAARILETLLEQARVE